MQINVRKWLLILVAFGALMRAYDINAPWKRKDHYNYGGVHTTKMSECLQTTPLAVSKGIPHNECEGGEMREVYPNHPPTLLFAINAWKTLWGSHDPWAYRSFVMIFSWLNILLVFLISARLFPNTLTPYWAAAVQSLTIGGLYFGTHPDFICEFAVFFPLLAAYLYLRSAPNTAGFVTVLGGLASWPSFLGFGGQGIYVLLEKKKKWPLILWGMIGVACGLGLMMWLQQTFDIVEFLRHKLTKPNYLTAAEQKNQFYVFDWIKTFFQYHSNYLSPFFLLCLIFELLATTVNKEWRRNYVANLFLVGGCGIIYTILGQEYVYVHAFLYLYLFPLYALLIARWIDRCLNRPATIEFLQQRLWLAIFLIIFVFAMYPFGRLQSNFVHDVINSILLTGSTIALVVLLYRRKLTQKNMLIVLTIAGLGNVSQMVNYRNEPAKDYEFCKQARIEFDRTQGTVQSPLDRHFTRDFYCKDIPLMEPPDEQR